MHCQLRPLHTKRSFPSPGPSRLIAGIVSINANREPEMRIAKELLQVLFGVQAEATVSSRETL